MSIKAAMGSEDYTQGTLGDEYPVRLHADGNLDGSTYTGYAPFDAELWRRMDPDYDPPVEDKPPEKEPRVDQKESVRCEVCGEPTHTASKRPGLAEKVGELVEVIADPHKRRGARPRRVKEKD